MASNWSDFLARAFTGGADELTADNLVRLVVEGIVNMRTRGRKGVTHLPTEVEVVVTVNSGSIGVVRRFIEDSSFEEEICQRLLNRLLDVPQSAHPLRLYKVAAGERNSVEVHEVSQPLELAFEIRGGQFDGQEISVPTSQRDLRMGRGPHHGGDHDQNDLIVTEQDTFVSRRAARIRRLGGHIRIRALDQGDELVVVKPNGERVRPNRTIESWAPVRPGDRIELTDGSDAKITLVLKSVSRRIQVEGDDEEEDDTAVTPPEPPIFRASVELDAEPTRRTFPTLVPPSGDV
ncbi:MAG: FHA domain-containing protein [Myxococcales bacterium]|nr:FHA domain-containing protein [Myxococcales bacterium]